MNAEKMSEVETMPRYKLFAVAVKRAFTELGEAMSAGAMTGNPSLQGPDHIPSSPVEDAPIK